MVLFESTTKKVNAEFTIQTLWAYSVAWPGSDQC